jgi:hypothetical protein
MLGAAHCGEYRQAAGVIAEVVALITMVPRMPIWSLRGLVLRIGSTGTTNPIHGSRALLKCYEAAIRGAESWSIICTPRIVLRLCGSFGADDGHENSANEQQKSHGRLPLAPCRKRQPHAFVSVLARQCAADALEFKGKTQAGPNKSHPTSGGYSSRRATNNSSVPQLAILVRLKHPLPLTLSSNSCSGPSDNRCGRRG